MKKNDTKKPSDSKKKLKDDSEDNKFTKPVLKVIQFEDLIFNEALDSQAAYYEGDPGNTDY